MIYTSFIGALQTQMPPVIYGAAVLLCSSTGTFWQAQGNYLKRLTQDNKKTVGRYNGIFQAMYLGSNFLGTLTIALMFFFLQDAEGNIPRHVRVIAVWVLVGLAGASCIVFTFLRPVPKVRGADDDRLKDKALAVVNSLKDRNLQVMLVYLVGMYMGYTFPFSGFSVNIPLRLVPWVFTAYGGACIVGSFGIGFIIDKTNARVITGIHLGVALITYTLVYVSIYYKIVPLYFVVGGLFGIFDSISMTFSSSLIMKALPPDVYAGGMSVNRIIWGFSGVVVFVIQIFSPWHATGGVVISTFTLGCIIQMIFIREKRYMPETQPLVHEKKDASSIANIKDNTEDSERSSAVGLQSSRASESEVKLDISEDPSKAQRENN
jgi:MFS family permease